MPLIDTRNACLGFQKACYYRLSREDNCFISSETARLLVEAVTGKKLMQTSTAETIKLKLNNETITLRGNGVCPPASAQEGWSRTDSLPCPGEVVCCSSCAQQRPRGTHLVRFSGKFCSAARCASETCVQTISCFITEYSPFFFVFLFFFFPFSLSSG